MKYLQENLCYILILFSLCISIIGAFTNTYKKESTGRDRLTIWGYVIGVLLVVSALGTLLSTIDSKKKDAVKLRQDSIRTYNDSIKLVESNLMLSQQKFINIISAVSNYSLKDTPCLVFRYHYDTKKNNVSFIPQNYSYYYKLKTFPGFGMHVDTLLLNFNLASGHLSFLTDDLNSENSNDTTYFFNKYNASTLSKPLVKKDNDFIFFSNQNDEFIQYNFRITGGPKSLPEWLYDLRSERNIGSLQIINNRQAINSDQKKIICNMFAEKNCKAYIRIFLKNENLHAISPCIDIPLSIKPDFTIINDAQINLRTKDPEMTNEFH